MRKWVLLYLFVCPMLTACIDAYNVSIKSSTGYIVVDGGLTDAAEPQSIYLSKTDSTQASALNEFSQSIIGNKKQYPISNANVQLIVNGNKTVQLTENAQTAGQYDYPDGFYGKVGDTYQLKIQIKGVVYQSLVERMMPTSSISKIYDTFNSNGIKKPADGSEIVPTNDVYIDFTDDPSQRNFYRWTSKVYEVQTICRTCIGGRYYWYQNQINVAGDCFPDPYLDADNIFDYPCASPTWDIFYSSDLNIFSDINTNGLTQRDKLIAQIILRQANPCLIAIQQMSLTQGAFEYFRLINDQAIVTGGLVDTPPGRLQGNVRNTVNPAELVLGYFSVSSVHESRYMVLRNNLDKNVVKSFNNLFVFENGRDPFYEGQTLVHPKQVFAIGLESHTRTIVQPQGWQL